MPLDPSGVPSRAQIQAAINEALLQAPIIKQTGALWGTLFNAATHRPKIYATSVVNAPTTNGDIDLLALASEFVGISSTQVTIGDITSVAEVRTWIFSNTTLVGRCYNSGGSVITSGSQRLNLTVFGWVAI